MVTVFGLFALAAFVPLCGVAFLVMEAREALATRRRRYRRKRNARKGFVL